MTPRRLPADVLTDSNRSVHCDWPLALIPSLCCCLQATRSRRATLLSCHGYSHWSLCLENQKPSKTPQGINFTPTNPAVLHRFVSLDFSRLSLTANWRCTLQSSPFDSSHRKICRIKERFVKWMNRHFCLSSCATKYDITAEASVRVPQPRLGVTFFD